jgi:ligand-binding sensor domain-containing protein/signal transduction histidine kinase
MVLSLCAGALAASAARGEYLIQTWTADDGLPANDVRSIAQTPDGYLWVAMLHGGLARFDGVRFVTFEPGNTFALATLEMHKVLLDDQGVLWIGGVAPWLFSYRDGQFIQQNALTMVPDSMVKAVVSASTNEVLLSAENGLLLRGSGPPDQPRQWELVLTPGRYAATVYWPDSQGDLWCRLTDTRVGRGRPGEIVALSPEVAPGGRVLDLAVDREGTVWAGTPQELARWDGQRFVNATPTNGEPDLNVSRVFPAGNHGLWVVANNRLRRVHHGQWVAECNNWNPKLLPRSLLAYGAYTDRHGGLWITRRGDGVWYISPEGRQVHLTVADGLPTLLVNCWFEDREGNIWLGTSGGLARLTPRGFQPAQPASQFHQPATSVAEVSPGHLWAGFADGRVSHRTSKAWEPLPAPADVKDISICPGRNGEVYVGTVGQGLLVVRDGIFSSPFESKEIGGAVRALMLDRAGKLWIGNERGLFTWDGRKVRAVAPTSGASFGMVCSLAEDADGAIWIGTAKPELWSFRGGQFSRFVPGDEVRGQRFWSLLADKDGVIWIGSLGGGLLRFREGRFARFLPRDGLPSAHICQVLEDDADNLWLGTRHGICRVPKQSLHAYAAGQERKLTCVTYDRSDGLPTVECLGGFQPSGWRAHDGRLWFATGKGPVSVQPRDLIRNTLAPQVVIEEVLVDGRPLPLAPPRNSHDAASLTVSPGRHYYEFRFAGLSFTAPGKVSFRWRLEGLETDWVEGGTQRVASYSFLPAGQYRFRVKACNNDGLWNETGAAMTLHVLPFFWQTAWFRVAAWAGSTTLVAGVVFAIVRGRQLRKLRLLERNHALDQERARIARDIHDDLGMNLAQIGMLSDWAQSSVPADTPAQESMNEIFTRANEAVRKLDEIVWAINPGHDTLEHLAGYLAKTAREYLSAADVRCRLDLPDTLPAVVLSAAQRHNLVLAAKEALHNAVRHGAPAEVTLRLRVDNHCLTVTITDDGKGCDPDQLLSSDRGLANLRERLHQLHGRVHCRTAPGSGTTIAMNLPLDSLQPHFS